MSGEEKEKRFILFIKDIIETNSFGEKLKQYLIKREESSKPIESVLNDSE